MHWEQHCEGPLHGQKAVIVMSTFTHILKVWPLPILGMLESYNVNGIHDHSEDAVHQRWLLVVWWSNRKRAWTEIWLSEDSTLVRAALVLVQTRIMG
eukprot:6387590-Amphidinium_carterae.1